LKEITDEAYAFCAFEHGDPLPDGKGGVISFEYVPSVVYWNRWCIKNGLPNGGGWLNQPLAFMQDIDAARRGEERYIKELNERTGTNALLRRIASLLEINA